MRTDRPLAEADFQTDGLDLFVGELFALVNVTCAGQTEMADVSRDQLKRIEREPEKFSL